MKPTSKHTGESSHPESNSPQEVEVDMSRADWLADIEVAVTPQTPDPLAGKHGGQKSNDG